MCGNKNQQTEMEFSYQKSITNNENNEFMIKGF